MILSDYFEQILQPPGKLRTRYARTGIVVLLTSSALCIYLAPLAMPLGYSWLSNAISETAAQGLSHAWIARLGFILFGLAVVWLALFRRNIWARGVYWMQLAFAIFMLGTAAFSHKPWLIGVVYDPNEDFLHSLTASGMGFAFAFGVVVRLIQRQKGTTPQKVYDLIAVLAATLLTPIGEAIPSIAGALQRGMFAIAYLWFIHETLVPPPESERRTRQDAQAGASKRRG